MTAPQAPILSRATNPKTSSACPGCSRSPCAPTAGTCVQRSSGTRCRPCRRACKARNGCGIGLQFNSMRDCRLCGAHTVTSKTGLATCLQCQKVQRRIKSRQHKATPEYLAWQRAYVRQPDVQERNRIAKTKYRATPKYQEIRHRYSQQPKVKEKGRQRARSPQGKADQKRYLQTDKGRESARLRSLRHRATPKAKESAALHHQLTKNLPIRKLQKRLATKKNRLKRRALLKGNGLTTTDWLAIVKAHKGRCHYCRKLTPLTMDHVIPLSKGGRHSPENIVPACQSCNSKKNNRLIRLL